MYRALASRNEPGKWHFSQENYSGSQAMGLADSLEEQGYEVHLRAVDSAQLIHIGALPEQSQSVVGSPGYSLESELDLIEGKRIDEAVEASHGNVSQAAVSLGMTRDKLDYRIHKHHKVMTAHV